MPIKEEPSAQQNADAFAPVPRFVVFRRLFTELMGAFLLVCVDCGGAITRAPPIDRSIATGLIVMAMSSAMSTTSGAHFNPAVTTAFALRGAFPWKMVPLYWLAQLGGAFLGSAALLCTFGDVEHLGATLPKMSAHAALAAEIVCTMTLVLVALGTATRHRVLGAQAAIATGGTIAACTLVARPISGASMNPARSLAPAVLSHTPGWLWIYVAGPLVGAVLAWLASIVIHTKKHFEEREAAGGEPK
jgi:MIP family channel proteins